MAEKSFLYLLPEVKKVSELLEALPFLTRKQVEVWTQVNLMEITLQNAAFTFEDIMEDLLGAVDEKLLSALSMKQVYACDYDDADALDVQKIMNALLDAYGGMIVSDTKDFKPYLSVEEL